MSRRITYPDKDKTSSIYAEKKVRDIDLNEIKTAVNEQVKSQVLTDGATVAFDVSIANIGILVTAQTNPVINIINMLDDDAAILLLTGTGTADVGGTDVTMSGSEQMVGLINAAGVLRVNAGGSVGTGSGGSGGGTTLPTPTAPAGGTVDDTANTFTFTPATGYAATAHEYSVNGGSTWANCSSNVVNVGDVSITSGNVKIRVKAVTDVNNAGAILSSSSAFTVAGGGGGSATFLTVLASTGTGTLNEDPTHTFTSAEGFKYGVMNESLAADTDGEFVFDLPDDNVNNLNFGVDTDSTNDYYSSGFDWLCFARWQIIPGLSIGVGGTTDWSLPLSGSYPSGTGKKLKIRRAGGIITLQYYNGSAWSTAHTYASSTAQLWFKFHISAGFHLVNAKLIVG